MSVNHGILDRFLTAITAYHYINANNKYLHEEKIF